jgi:transposase
VIGDVSRFPSSRHLVGYLGLHPKIRQSGSRPARHGRTSKKGSAAARHFWSRRRGRPRAAPGRCAPSPSASAPAAAATSRPSPSRASSPCSRGICSRGEDYAFARPGIVARKRRRLELAAGAPRRKSGPNGNPVWASTAQHRAERRIAEQAETAYRRLINDWQSSGPRVGAGATPGRASEMPAPLAVGCGRFQAKVRC